MDKLPAVLVTDMNEFAALDGRYGPTLSFQLCGSSWKMPGSKKRAPTTVVIDPAVLRSTAPTARPISPAPVR